MGSVEAGPKVAAILSVVESCRRMGIPVRQYLLSVLPGMGDRKVSEVAELTPDGLVAGAAGLAEFEEVRKAGDGRTLSAPAQAGRR